MSRSGDNEERKGGRRRRKEKGEKRKERGRRGRREERKERGRRFIIVNPYVSGVNICKCFVC